MDDPETRVTLMSAMSVNAITVRSIAAVAETRETARAFLEDPRQPAIAPGSRGHPVLIMSELVANALRHGGGHLEDGPPGEALCARFAQ
jgi:hypothetical protein